MFTTHVDINKNKKITFFSVTGTHLEFQYGHPFSTYAVRGEGNFAYFPMYAHIKIAYRGGRVKMAKMLRTYYMDARYNRFVTNDNLRILFCLLYQLGICPV